ncbi:UDP-2,4-diacetamido-2,4,6-trideoxy-beta-L-altropyranose hydrolase [Candidatus Marinimicrobia bacterium]|nr:UDP-2,4-diacetamido-2,4,6-trideoxy-beta-L-altropyranose hydrolase [Candidatus Neomarinimicrobiota bacterium]
MENILIRADSSNEIGTGHIMRTLVLANQFKKSNIYFATRDLKNNINHKILEQDFDIVRLKSKKSKELIKHIHSLKIDMLVIDHYDIDYSFEKKIKKETGAEIFVLDDNFNKHFCDIILNHNIYAKKEQYYNLVPKNCKIMCGPEFTLLRNEFYELKNVVKKSNNDKFKKVLITMGGADSRNLSIRIVEILKDFKNIFFTIVSTRANKNINELKKYSKKNNRTVELIIETDKIAELMQSSDIIICTPSVTVNECYYLDISFIAIKTEDNQRYMTEFLMKKGYNVLESIDNQKLKEKFSKIISTK